MVNGDVMQVHSVPDLVAGLGLGLLCLWGGCEGSRAFEAMATGHALGPVLVLATTLALILVYPRPDKVRLPLLRPHSYKPLVGLVSKLVFFSLCPVMHLCGPLCVL